ncbi:MAG: aspartyl-tRNA(Asn)/glutamyl-tRNA(Gln) amidotransferase subunit, partial [Chloroflexota bacterium]|nr:aspartyl-tRNA(Asn)/glutamyl-tRNA(Gln) amidotransferase subunit [Chloroflexota bacterium]
MGELPRTITETAQRLRAREVSAVELADAFLDAARSDPFNAWLSIEPEHAKAQARAADTRLGSGADAPVLTGVPWACKDIIGTKGIATTAASKILAGYKPAY